MRKRDKLTIKLSEHRDAINSFLDKDELTDDERGELESLTKRAQETEVELRAAITAEPDPTETRHTDTPEGAELRALGRDSDMAAIFEAVLDHRATTGREAELQAHHNLASNQVPLTMIEQRAVTPAPADVGTNQAQIIPGVFPMSCAAFLSVDMPTVGVGEAVFPVLSTNASVGTPAENGPQAETTGSFSADVLSPSRLQASFFYSRHLRRLNFMRLQGATRTDPDVPVKASGSYLRWLTVNRWSGQG